ncbi:MAG: hypothetical protein J6R20_03610 [Clostridia bacterium]|nr:hypothetical protein [Clostridia bacterium]
MKKKLFYIIPVLAAVAVIGFAATKIPFPSAPPETSAESTSLASTSATTEVFTSESSTVTATEKITEIIKSTTKKQAVTTVQPSTEAPTQTSTTITTTKFLNLTMPDFQIPTLKQETTVAPTKPVNAEYDSSCFDNTVFVGNSRFVSFKNFGLAKNVYPVVGLNVDTVFTKSVAGSSVPVIDELNGKTYEKVILLFGDNECGWPNHDVFAEKYAKVIAAVRERIPEAEIYLHAVLPVSVNASATNEFGCNNETITKLNKKIEELAAKEGVHFIPQPECLKAEDGTLIPEAASDGIHLNKKYAKIWISSLADEIIYNVGE